LLRRLTNALNIDVPRLASDPFPPRASRRRVAASPPTTSTLRARVPSRVSLAVPVARDRDAARSPRRGAFAASIAARARRRARRRRAFVVVAVSRRLFRLFRGRERREMSIAEMWTSRRVVTHRCVIRTYGS
jgi:hypothetical protein